MVDLSQKNILLGITGSIAAYKSADLVRLLKKAGAEVRVVMSENAKHFITPLTMQAVSGRPVYDQLFDSYAEAAMSHIALARWADLILVAPASANFIAQLAQGIANDLLGTLCITTKNQVAIAPAMNQGMWLAKQNQNNIAHLKKLGTKVFGPAEGSQACGEFGLGRMVEPQSIVENVKELFDNNLLSGIRVVITAGTTRESIDPVRYLSNRSSGKMGYALAVAAKEAGALVTLISGPTTESLPANIQCIKVITAQEMHRAVLDREHDCDIFIGVAAVSDFRIKNPSQLKLAKTDRAPILELEENPDIIASVSKLNKKPFIVGFAAETDNLIDKAKAKLSKKNMDMIIANSVGLDIGMESDDNEVTVITKDEMIPLPLLTKKQLAIKLIRFIKNAASRNL